MKKKKKFSNNLDISILCLYNTKRKEQYGGFGSIFVNILLFIVGLCVVAAGGSLIFAVNVFLSRRERRQAKKICKRFERLN